MSVIDAPVKAFQAPHGDLSHLGEALVEGKAVMMVEPHRDGTFYVSISPTDSRKGAKCVAQGFYTYTDGLDYLTRLINELN